VGPWGKLGGEGAPPFKKPKKIKSLQQQGRTSQKARGAQPLRQAMGKKTDGHQEQEKTKQSRSEFLRERAQKEKDKSREKVFKKKKQERTNTKQKNKRGHQKR